MQSKKLGSIKKSQAKQIISSPFDITAHKTERTAVALLMHWMRNIIQEKQLDLGAPDVETGGKDNKFPDTVIYESPHSQNVLCVIEAKPPWYDVFDEKELKEPARKKATERKAKYFALTNFRKLIWYKTEAVNSLRPEEEQIVDKYILSDIENLNHIEDARHSNTIREEIGNYLTKLYKVSTGLEPEPKQAIDEFLILRLQEKIKKLANYYRVIIEDTCHNDNKFAKNLKNWFIEQGWNFAWQSQDFDKASRQTAYLLVNKIIFYDLIQAKRPRELATLEMQKGLKKGSQLQTMLQSFFDEVLKIDYQTIYTTDFIDVIAFPDSEEVIKDIEELINILRRYDFSKIGYDIIGRIFEKLIPQQERHNLGQYFTSSDIVDLILKFCLTHENDKVFDPACGAGTFLVRAYQHKKLMNQYLKHEDIINNLWGCDIAKFPAHLATINIAINNLASDKNYPRILHKDFFELIPDKVEFNYPELKKVKVKSLDDAERIIEKPYSFDCIVGNPPYTRQEEITKILQDEKYKNNLVNNALRDINGKILGQISERAGIHAYFFFHGTKFLKESGKFGFIVSNSWLDVDYGKGLQEMFLKNYKIISIIESKIERWFEDADINTCIIILQKCSGDKLEKERDENLVRFVYLKKSLSYFIPPAQDMWEKQVERLISIDNLKKTIFAHSEFYENEYLRIFPISQKKLRDEGFDKEENTYTGAKWGKYLKAPQIFFKILNKGKYKLAPLNEVADVIGGIITGNNSFFYFDKNKENKIESQFLKPVIKTPREITEIILKESDLKYKILICNQNKKELKGTKTLSYIKSAEGKNIHKAETFKNRELWYSLSEKKAPLLWVDLRGDKHICHLNLNNILFEHNFYGLYPKVKNTNYEICAILNSTISWLFIEIFGRTGLGGGAIRLVGKDITKFPTINVKKISDILKEKIRNNFETLGRRKIGSAFSEIGAYSLEEVSLDKVKPDRRELDKIIMGEILGLTEEEQLEVYKAVIDLVKSRIEKAKTFGKKQKTKEGIDIDLLVKTILDKVGENTLNKFYNEKILTQKELINITLPKIENQLTIDNTLYGIRLTNGKKYFECSSKEEAEYLKIWIELELDKIKVPKDINYLKKILPELKNLKAKINEIINSYLEAINDKSVKKKVEGMVWGEVIRKL